MTHIQVTTVSMKTTPLDFEGNFKTIIQILQQKELNDSSIVVFPELALSGYGCEDAFLYSFVCEKSLSYLKKILPFSKNRLLSIGLPLSIPPKIYNACALLHNEKILGFVTKNNLASRQIFYENRWFSTLSSDIVGNEQLLPEHIPVGNFSFRFLDVHIGIQICEDLWVDSCYRSTLQSLGVNIFLVSNASPFEMNKHHHRLNLIKQQSILNRCVFIYSNLNGNEAGNLIFEGGALVVANGEILAQTERLHFEDYQTATVTFSLKELSQKQLRHYNHNDYVDLLPKPNEQLISEKLIQKNPKTIIKKDMNEKICPYNDFTKAVCLGLWDYLTKSKTKGYTISLSGGVDSSVCVILVHTMKKFALQKLGKQTFQKFGLYEKEILQTVYQKTKNNSNLTEEIAWCLSKEVHSLHHNIEIDSEIESICQKVENAENISLSWENHNLTLQNIQARVRSPIVWMFANLKNHLLISTSNRSEASVGYCTMDGDTSGSISPIGGLSKKFLLEWFTHIQEGKNLYISPLKSIEMLLNTKPTAELKPLNEKQEDEKDLMPYEILDKIEYEFVQNGKTQEEILASIKFKNKEKLREYINKYFHLFQTNQWKRTRLAPTFHLDSYDLDYKANFRFPIFSGKW